uniref:Reverse transcriptase domain-containing protein n=1 Tax=Hordeum vulgare subsp. vulgare TaxID=112509 RepID=A0A8I7B1C9_HORVV
MSAGRTSPHTGKASILHDYFKNIIGTTSNSAINFDLDRLLSDSKLTTSQACSLIRPFSLEEIKMAILTMNVNASPRPDGFGPAFFRINWDLVKHDLLALMNDFHIGSADLRRINRAFIVLLPKRVGASSPDNFRPVSLQNCIIKISSKCLASRAQPFIPLIIHHDQSGFIKGRSIADNFIYAADIVQTCFKRKKSTIVLKLDFHKAFDSVSWDALMATLKAKGFPSKWCDWIQNLNETSQSAVLLNGKPGPWIACKKGLRQGDPTSPLLFIIVADVLQRLIHEASSNGLLSHPIDSNIPCPVLQYADDTLIILQADIEQLHTLKSILLQFSNATGLVINFHKSTFAPIHVEPTLASALASILGCTVASFPQSYLGLPLSTHKLNIKDFFFIIDKIDRRLAGWRGVLLNIAGRAILVRVVLRALPIYAMTALWLPAGIVQEIDKRCRAFFWAGQEKVSGGQCKVAWEFVCAPFSRGG